MIRHLLAPDPRRFGQRLVLHAAIPVPVPQRRTASNDLKLFATTFLGGFLFVSILIA